MVNSFHKSKLILGIFFILVSKRMTIYSTSTPPCMESIQPCKASNPGIAWADRELQAADGRAEQGDRRLQADHEHADIRA